MVTLVLYLIAALVVGAIVFGVAVLITGDDQGIEGDEPDGRAIPLPSTRPLGEGDISQVRFDTVVRGYRMAQVDAAFRRAAYDIGYKEELIQVLEAEVNALRDGRTEEADQLRRAREAAVSGASTDSPRPVHEMPVHELAIDLDDDLELDAADADKARDAKNADEADSTPKADDSDEADESVEADQAADEGAKPSSTVSQ
jgi:DivIVA domain-containing protein